MCGRWGSRRFLLQLQPPIIDWNDPTQYQLFDENLEARVRQCVDNEKRAAAAFELQFRKFYAPSPASPPSPPPKTTAVVAKKRKSEEHEGSALPLKKRKMAEEGPAEPEAAVYSSAEEEEDEDEEEEDEEDEDEEEKPDSPTSPPPPPPSATKPDSTVRGKRNPKPRNVCSCYNKLQ